jgi:hypothetical protein
MGIGFRLDWGGEGDKKRCLLDGGGSSFRVETFALDTGGVGEGVSNGGLGNGFADCMSSERASWTRCSARHVIEISADHTGVTSAFWGQKAPHLKSLSLHDDLSLLQPPAHQLIGNRMARGTSSCRVSFIDP